MAFVLDSDDLFIDSADGFVVRVLKNDTFRANDFILMQPIWTSVKNVNPANDDQLNIFGCVLFGGKLKELAAELKRIEFVVNRLGYVYANTKSHSHCRLNDLFDWRKYGVNPPFTNLWNRCSLYNKESIVSILELENSLRDSELQLQEVEIELYLSKKRSEDKEKELQDCKSQLDLEKRLQWQELDDCKQQLKEKERELAVMVRLLENQLEVKEEMLHNKQKKDQEFEKVRCQLLVEQKRVTGLKIAMESMVNYLGDLHERLGEELGYDYDFPLRSLGHLEENACSFEGGSSLSRTVSGTRPLDIIAYLSGDDDD